MIGTFYSLVEALQEKYDEDLIGLLATEVEMVGLEVTAEDLRADRLRAWSAIGYLARGCGLFDRSALGEPAASWGGPPPKVETVGSSSSLMGSGYHLAVHGLGIRDPSAMLGAVDQLRVQTERFLGLPGEISRRDQQTMGSMLEALANVPSVFVRPPNYVVRVTAFGFDELVLPPGRWVTMRFNVPTIAKLLRIRFGRGFSDVVIRVLRADRHILVDGGKDGSSPVPARLVDDRDPSLPSFNSDTMQLNTEVVLEVRNDGDAPLHFTAGLLFLTYDEF